MYNYVYLIHLNVYFNELLFVSTCKLVKNFKGLKNKNVNVLSQH